MGNKEHSLDEATVLHKAGRLAEAESIYRRILKQQPENADAMHLLGVVAHQSGKNGLAEKLIRRAIRLNSTSPAYHCNLGRALKAQGNLDKAVACFETALDLDSADLAARANLGGALHDLGRLDKAVAAYRLVLDANPDHPSLHGNLGGALHDLGQPKEALSAYRRALEIDPANADVWYNVALILEQLEDRDGALEAYRKAAEARPDFAAALLNMGGILMDKGDAEAARAAFERAAAAKPASPNAHNARGGALFRLRRYGEAEAAYRQALTHDRKNLSALSNLAGIQVALGKFGDARKTCLRILKIEPGHAYARRQLSLLDSDGGDDDGLGIMARLADDPATADSERIDLCFALGKVLTRREQYDQAFARFENGNRLKRATLSYDHAAQVARCTKVFETFSKDFLAAQNPGRDPDKTVGGPIFIVGMPRSGSTLVEQILASHSEVEGGDELEFMPQLVAEFELRQADTAKFDFAALGKAYLEVLRGVSLTAPRIVDKQLNNFINIGHIHLALPGAVIINCRRDPLDTCLSIFTVLFTSQLGYCYDLEEIGRFHKLYEKAMDHWHRVLPGRVVDVRYEDIIADQEGQSRRIIEACGLDWQEACLSFHTTKRPVITASAHQVRRPLYTDSVGRWRHFAQHLEPLARALGPEARAEWKSAVES